MTNCGGSGSDLKEAPASTASAPTARPSAHCCQKEQGTVTVRVSGAGGAAGGMGSRVAQAGELAELSGEAVTRRCGILRGGRV